MVAQGSAVQHTLRSPDSFSLARLSLSVSIEHYDSTFHDPFCSFRSPHQSQSRLTSTVRVPEVMKNMQTASHHFRRLAKWQHTAPSLLLKSNSRPQVKLKWNSLTFRHILRIATVCGVSCRFQGSLESTFSLNTQPRLKSAKTLSVDLLMCEEIQLS